MKKFFLGVLAVVVFVMGCSKQADEPDCNFDPCSLKAPQAEIDSLRAYIESNNIPATEHCSGVFYVINEQGSDEVLPNICTRVGVNYTGRLLNGTQFDAGTAEFVPTQLIYGWWSGIRLIGKGGKIRLYIPPSLGYGSEDYPSSSNPKIPGGSSLIFDIEIIDF